jgi:hypothetical protein
MVRDGGRSLVAAWASAVVAVASAVEDAPWADVDGLFGGMWGGMLAVSSVTEGAWACGGRHNNE